jgi:xylose isomerase
MEEPTLKIATHLGYWGSSGDRYNPAGYKQAVPALERLRQAAGVAGLSGVELNYPALVQEETAAATVQVLRQVNLAAVNVSLNVWGERCWRMGSITSPDPSVRAAAVSTMQRGMAVARAVGSPLVSLWPGQDGFDYPFEVDYATQVDWFVGGMREAAAIDPNIRICLEYKLKEPRTHLLLDTAARALWLVGKIGAPNVGVLLDVGHGFAAYENVAQSAVLLQREGVLDLLHMSDNYGEWDWDMIPGTVRFWEYLELYFWLRELGYDGWYSIDIAVPRSDAVTACRQSVNNIRRLYRLAGRLDRQQILANLQDSSHPQNPGLVADMVFGALDGWTGSDRGGVS